MDLIVLNIKKNDICLRTRNRLDKSNRPSRSIPKVTEIDTRWIGCGSLLRRSDLSDRRGLKSYKKSFYNTNLNVFVKIKTKITKY
jgi:hypothetical protein